MPSGLPAQRELQPFFYPRPTLAPSAEYAEFIRVREKVLDVIRTETPEKSKVLDDIVDALLEYDKGLPTGLLSSALAVVGLGKKVTETTRRRVLYRKVVASILEQIFDPGLEYRLTQRDILDAFEANGLDRAKVTSQQIGQIYVKVVHKLRVGELRDLTYEEQLYRYVRLKLSEIMVSRQDWELNGR